MYACCGISRIFHLYRSFYCLGGLRFSKQSSHIIFSYGNLHRIVLKWPGYNLNGSVPSRVWLQSVKQDFKLGATVTCTSPPQPTPPPKTIDFYIISFRLILYSTCTAVIIPADSKTNARWTIKEQNRQLDFWFSIVLIQYVHQQKVNI